MFKPLVATADRKSTYFKFGNCPFSLWGLTPSFCLTEKTEDDMEREARLVEQWVGLTEERNAVLVPAPGSGIPGAPADW